MRMLIIGASGQLGGYLLRELWRQDVPAVAWSGSRSGVLFDIALQPVNLADIGSLATAFRAARPTLVIHAGAVTTIAACFRDPRQAQLVNAEATIVLAELAAEAGARLLLVSTDLAFDGKRGCYREVDPPSPLSTYGRTKVAAEKAVLASPGGVVVRLSLLLGPTLVGRPSILDTQAVALQEGRRLELFDDEWRTPLGLATGAQALLALARSDYVGLLHMGGPERLTRLEIGQRLATCLRSDQSVIVPVSRTSVASPEPRPRDTSLDSSLCRQLFPRLTWPTWDQDLRRIAT